MLEQNGTALLVQNVTKTKKISNPPVLIHMQHDVWWFQIHVQDPSVVQMVKAAAGASGHWVALKMKHLSKRGCCLFNPGSYGNDWRQTSAVFPTVLLKPILNTPSLISLFALPYSLCFFCTSEAPWKKCQIISSVSSRERFTLSGRPRTKPGSLGQMKLSSEPALQYSWGWENQLQTNILYIMFLGL